MTTSLLRYSYDIGTSPESNPPTHQSPTSIIVPVAVTASIVSTHINYITSASTGSWEWPGLVIAVIDYSTLDRCQPVNAECVSPTSI